MRNDSTTNRPYLVIPEIIEQPTWGGDYILSLKGWSDHPNFKGKKIGQSYELSNHSKLAVDKFDSKLLDPVGNKSIDISKVESKKVLLIKINQARGNSFQIHIKPTDKSQKWKPKPESWYFLEPGHISLGIKKGIDISRYQSTCYLIDEKMHDLSHQIAKGEFTLSEARLFANEIIVKHDPWQFVNVYDTQKYDVINLSAGAVHHSWEADMVNHPMGNIVFEVQLDVSDGESTIRAFDQGKLKDDGKVRPLNIDDYFNHLDTDPENNKLENLSQKLPNNQLMKSEFYFADLIEDFDFLEIFTNGSYQHLYVRNGGVKVSANNFDINVESGFSCFIPSTLTSFTITPTSSVCSIIKTHP